MFYYKLGYWLNKQSGVYIMGEWVCLVRSHDPLIHRDNAVDHCKKALMVLDDCHSNTEEWHYNKGLAHLWLGVCLYSLLTR